MRYLPLFSIHHLYIDVQHEKRKHKRTRIFVNSLQKRFLPYIERFPKMKQQRGRGKHRLNYKHRITHTYQVVVHRICTHETRQNCFKNLVPYVHTSTDRIALKKSVRNFSIYFHMGAGRTIGEKSSRSLVGCPSIGIRARLLPRSSMSPAEQRTPSDDWEGGEDG